jgi:hypothetical protein
MQTNKSVLVLGTDHRYQRRDKALDETQHVAFAQLLTEICRAHCIKVIAEENNADAMAEDEIEESAPQQIARTLDLIHRHCDPDLKTRARLGIQQENQIRVSQLPKRLAENVIQEKLRASQRARELYWVEELLQLNVWPVLFICGADHSIPLLALLKSKGIQPLLIAADWESKP